MRTVRPPALVGALGLLERAVGYSRVALTGVRPGLLGRPTPCTAWDLRALLAHMDDSLAALHEAGEGGAVTLAPAPAPGLPIVTSLRTRACDLLGAWTSDGGVELVRVAGSPLSAAVLAAAGALEIAVHGWDVAVACGLDHPLPAPLAAELLDLVDLLVAPGDRPRRFAAPLSAPPGAGDDVALLAALGRRPPVPVG